MTIRSRKPVFSHTARADLRSIYTYIARQNPDADARFILDIHLKILAIAESGFPGMARDEIHVGLRVLPYRDRCIYFRLEETHIHVVRILHGRQDMSSKDFPESEI